MKHSGSARGRIPRFLSIMFAASLLAGPISSFAARAQATAPTPAPSAAPQPSAEELAKRKAWGATIARTPAPKKGCFTASYPKTEWQEVPCGRPSPYPNLARRPRPNQVGDSIDDSAQVSGLISSAVGSFVSVTPAAITEQGLVWTQQGCPPPICPPNHPNCIPMSPSGSGWCMKLKDDAFSLQLNSEPFQLNSEGPPSPSQIAACYNGSGGVCGWEQFVFSQDGCPGGPCIFIQYWLLNYGPTSPPSGCATGWMPSEGVNWYCNTNPTIVPHVSAAQLWETTLAGTAAGDGDIVVLTTAGVAGIAAPPAADGPVNLAQHWNAVEWNVFGDCCLFEADFSPGSTLVVNTSVNEGAVATCVQEGFTGETNNLSLVGTPPAQSSTPPAIVFAQSNGGGSPASCIFAGPPGPPVPPGKRHGGPGPACGHGHLPPCRHL
jgi:hypothetical protein